MKFSVEQIHQMLDIIKKNQAVFISGQLGIEYLTPYEKLLLKKSGIDLKNLKDIISEVDKAYFFGMMSFTLGDKKSYNVKPAEFKEWFENKIKDSKSASQKASLEFIKNRSFVDISGLGNKVSNKISNAIITSSQKEKTILRNKIKEKVIESVDEGKTQQWLASELKNITQDWARDFSRISNYVMQEAYGIGRAEQIFEDYGEDAKVYKQTFPGVCKDCLKNYGKPGEEPLIYSLKELVSNGNNIGRKEQLPVVGPAHPWARSILHVIPKNSVWDNESKRFVIKRNDQGVKRNSKVKVTIAR